MKKIRAAITGVGGYVPDYILTNRKLETMVDTSDEWISTRTGIKERRILKGENKGVSFMGARAAKDLLRRTGTDPLDIDLIIFATVTPDMLFPATANIVATEIGAVNSFSFDLSAACSGFIYALTTASCYVESGRYKKVLLIGGDKMSSIVDYQDRSTCIIFGDGAACVMIEPVEEEVGIIDSLHKTDAVGVPLLHMKAGGSLMPASHRTVDEKLHYVYQVGNHVFKYAVNSMSSVVKELLDKNGLNAQDVTWLAPHQANKRVISVVADYLKFPMEKVLLNIQRYGNTTAATIPLLFWDYESRLKKGDIVVSTAFGGGFTWGAVLMIWGYDGHKQPRQKEKISTI